MRLPFEKTRFSSGAILPLYLLGSGVLQGLLLLLVFFQGVQMARIANRPAPTMVQTVDGKVLQTSPEDALYRDPKVIERLVQEWFTLTFNNSGKLPNGSPDPGVSLGGFNNERVSTAAWSASFVLPDEGFRTDFLKGLSQLLPQNAPTVLEINHLSAPVPVQDKNGRDIPGEWLVNVVATLQVFERSHPEGNPLPLNKTVLLRVAPQPLYPLSDRVSPLEQAVYNLRQAGLEIYRIEDLTNAP